MKKLIYLILLTAICLFACQKTNFDLYNNQAIINGEEWDWAFQWTDYQTERNKTWTIVSLKLNEFRERRENIRFKNISTSITNDTIFLKLIETGSVRDSPNIPTAFFDLIGADGDLVLSVYEILETPDFPSWLLLERINDKVIKGKFQAIFVKSERWRGNITIRPDTLRVTEGEFLARNLD